MKKILFVPTFLILAFSLQMNAQNPSEYLPDKPGLKILVRHRKKQSTMPLLSLMAFSQSSRLQKKLPFLVSANLLKRA